MYLNYTDDIYRPLVSIISPKMDLDKREHVPRHLVKTNRFITGVYISKAIIVHMFIIDLKTGVIADVVPSSVYPRKIGFKEFIMNQKEYELPPHSSIHDDVLECVNRGVIYITTLPDQLSDEEIDQNIEESIGSPDYRYSIIFKNCQHYVHRMLQGEHRSWQLRYVSIPGLITLILTFAAVLYATRSIIGAFLLSAIATIIVVTLRFGMAVDGVVY